MQDEFFTTPRAAAKPARSGRTILIVAVLAFVMGAALVGWLAARGNLSSVFGKKQADTAITAQPLAAAASASPEPSAAPSAAAALPNAALPADTAQRLSSLESRLARLDLQAEAASGNAARAEGLLIAFAARRMIARGSPLGYLENQLTLRFADAQPNAVRTIIEAARQPVTLDQLTGQLEVIAPKLSTAPTQISGWDQLKHELSGLFVIRHDDTPSATPENRINRAQLLLAGGKIDAAITEVERLPGAPGAQDWIAAARRYAAAQTALDLIETTAMLEPNRLNNADGDKVQQPSPLAEPAG